MSQTFTVPDVVDEKPKLPDEGVSDMPPRKVTTAVVFALSATPCDVPVAVTKPPSVTLPPVIEKICTARPPEALKIVPP